MIELITPTMLTITEMQPNRDMAINYNLLLNLWIQGSTLSQALNQLSGEYLEIASQEGLADLIDDLFRYRLPWGISGYIRIAIQVLQIDRSNLSDITRFLPSMIKYGLPNPRACWVMSIGVPFRQTAIEIAAAFYREESLRNYQRFREWLSTISSERLRRDFHLSSPVLEDVAQSIFSAAINPHLRAYTSLDAFLPIEILVQGISYENRRLVALQILPGEELKLDRDYDNLVDRNAISVQYNNTVIASGVSVMV